MPHSADTSSNSMPDTDVPSQSLRSRGSRPPLQPSASRPVSFITPVHEGSSWPRKLSFEDRISLFFLQLLSVPISSLFLLLVVGWALLADLSRRLPKWLRPVQPASFPWDDTEKWKNEKCVKDVRYYARAVGMDIVDEEVETDDGYYLRYVGAHLTGKHKSFNSCPICRVHRVVNPKHKDGKGGYPVLILHGEQRLYVLAYCPYMLPAGLFQSSGAFITSEERSLAFWLSEHG